MKKYTVNTEPTEYEGCIKNITTGKWVGVTLQSGKISHCKDKKNAVIFWDEQEANQTLKMLNDQFADCYTLFDNVTPMSHPAYLFIGTCVTCYVYCDTTREKNGDYREIGRIYYSPLKLEISDNNKRYQDAHEIMRQKFEYLKTQTSIVVSGCGQTTPITL